jgi:polysaccharide pyruvyl transferase WcaK-like protein
MRFLAASSPDAVFLGDMLELIRQAPARAGSTGRARDGVLRILLLGYLGAGNTGADVRAIETIRQLRRILAGRPIAFTLLGFGELFDHPGFGDVARLTLATPYLPDALDAAVPGFDIVLNVEGSTYTSRFSDALAGSLIGGVALAAAHGSLAYAYGADTGAMSARLAAFAVSCAALAPDARVFCRSDASFARLGALGARPERGADAAWLYRVPADARPVQPPLPPRYAALCPNNPYCWPVLTDVRRALAAGSTPHAPGRHGPFTFYSWDDARARRFERYAIGYAALADALRERGIEPVLVAMERSDLAACEAIAARTAVGPRIVARPHASIDAVIGTLAQARCVIATRYHAALFAMAHAVPVFGVSMDERIGQLLDDAQLGGALASCDDPLFAQRALAWLDAVELASPEPLRHAYAELAARHTARFEAMGAQLRAALAAREADAAN